MPIKLLNCISILFACCAGNSDDKEEEKNERRRRRKEKKERKSPKPGTSRQTKPEDHEIINVLPALNNGWHTPARLAAEKMARPDGEQTPLNETDIKFVRDELELEQSLLQYEIHHVLSRDSNMAHGMGTTATRKRKREVRRSTQASVQQTARPGQVQTTTIASTGRFNRPKAAVRRRNVTSTNATTTTTATATSSCIGGMPDVA